MNDQKQPFDDNYNADSDLDSLLNSILEEINMPGKNEADIPKNEVDTPKDDLLEITAILDTAILDLELESIKTETQQLGSQNNLAGQYDYEDISSSSYDREILSSAESLQGFQSESISSVSADSEINKLRSRKSMLDTVRFDRISLHPYEDPDEFEDPEEEEIYQKQRSLGATIRFCIVHAIFYVFALIVIFITLLSVMRSNGSGVYNVEISGSKGFNVGDIVLVDSCEPSKVKPNDSVIFTFGDHDVLLTQNVISVDETGGSVNIVTDGNNLYSNKTINVDTNKFIGKITLRLPGMGNVVSFIENYLIFFIIIVAAVVLLFAYYNWKHFRKRSK